MTRAKPAPAVKSGLPDFTHQEGPYRASPIWMRSQIIDKRFRRVPARPLHRRLAPSCRPAPSRRRRNLSIQRLRAGAPGLDVFLFARAIGKALFEEKPRLSLDRQSVLRKQYFFFSRRSAKTNSMRRGASTGQREFLLGVISATDTAHASLDCSCVRDACRRLAIASRKPNPRRTRHENRQHNCRRAQLRGWQSAAAYSWGAKS